MESEKKRGRPASAVGKRPTMAFRMSEALHAHVAEAARANGRSMAEELERRLERSFAKDEMRSIIREELAASVTPLSPHAWRMDRDTMDAALRQFHREGKIHG